jgi:lipopolysaccharide transport system ATP-binding protein
MRAVTVENLSKSFVLGSAAQPTLREIIMAALSRARRAEAKERSTVWALRDVSFEIEQGELVGIIGRNGAGKSTLLKLLSRITYPTRGGVKVVGRVGSLLEVGTGFHEELTGRENIYLNGSILGMRKREIDRRLDEIIAFADVERFIDTPIKRYSSGMRLRLGFSVAAHLDTDILFVDEVLAVGDAAFQRKCLNAMGELQYHGRTVLFVSHNMTAVEHLCPRSIWIEGGTVRQDGASSDVIREYMSASAGLKHATLDLQSASDRRGDGSIRYHGLEILDLEQNPVNLVRSGDGLRLRLHYEAFQQIANPIFGIRLHSSSGVFLTDVSTWNLGVELPSLAPGRGFVDLTIDALNLMPGRYFLSLWLSGSGAITYDVLEHCAALDVEPSNYYRSGRGIDGRFGLVVLPCRWDVAGIDMASRDLMTA